MSIFRSATGRRFLSILLVFALAAVPAAAEDDAEASGPTTFEVVYDVAVLRTLGAVQTVVGVAMFAVAGPLSWPSGGWSEAWDVFVQVPYDETVTRKLGRF